MWLSRQERAALRTMTIAVTRTIALALLPLLARGAVETLYDDTIEERATDAEVLLVLFHDPREARCQDFAPHFEAAERELLDDGVPLARIDASTELAAVRTYQVDDLDLPQLVVFNRGASPRSELLLRAPTHSSEPARSHDPPFRDARRPRDALPRGHLQRAMAARARPARPDRPVHAHAG